MGALTCSQQDFLQPSCSARLSGRAVVRVPISQCMPVASSFHFCEWLQRLVIHVDIRGFAVHVEVEVFMCPHNCEGLVFCLAIALFRAG